MNEWCSVHMNPYLERNYIHSLIATEHTSSSYPRWPSAYSVWIFYDHHQLFCHLCDKFSWWPSGCWGFGDVMSSSCIGVEWESWQSSPKQRFVFVWWWQVRRHEWKPGDERLYGHVGALGICYDVNAVFLNSVKAFHLSITTQRPLNYVTASFGRAAHFPLPRTPCYITPIIKGETTL